MIRPITVLWLMLLAGLNVQAQEFEMLEYGQAITGELTSEVYEQTYTFAGVQSDVILLEMRPVESLGDLAETRLIVTNTRGDTLAEVEHYGSSRLFIELASSGTYTVIATRPDGIEGTDVGEFTLMIQRLSEIEPGQMISDTVTSEDGDHFYVYRGEVDFALEYTRQAGDFAPEVSVNVLENGALETVGALRGSRVQTGMIGVFPGGALYIIRLGEASFDFTFGRVTATYALEVVDVEQEGRG